MKCDSCDGRFYIGIQDPSQGTVAEQAAGGSGCRSERSHRGGQQAAKHSAAPFVVPGESCGLKGEDLFSGKRTWGVVENKRTRPENEPESEPEPDTRPAVWPWEVLTVLELKAEDFYFRKRTWGIIENKCPWPENEPESEPERGWGHAYRPHGSV